MDSLVGWISEHYWHALSLDCMPNFQQTIDISDLIELKLSQSQGRTHFYMPTAVIAYNIADQMDVYTWWSYAKYRRQNPWLFIYRNRAYKTVEAMHVYTEPGKGTTFG